MRSGSAPLAVSQIQPSPTGGPKLLHLGGKAMAVRADPHLAATTNATGLSTQSPVIIVAPVPRLTWLAEAQCGAYPER